MVNSVYVVNLVYSAPHSGIGLFKLADHCAQACEKVAARNHHDFVNRRVDFRQLLKKVYAQQNYVWYTLHRTRHVSAA